jgi:polysaccharide biosynthesis/export protein
MVFGTSSFNVRNHLRLAVLAGACVLALTVSRVAAQTNGYAIGAQDLLIINVWGHPDLSGKFSVEADGTISFPLVGRTKVGGLTVQSAESVLEKLLGEGFLKSPKVNISVDQYRSQQIFVMGEVKQPGAHPFTGELTVLEALARAGGVTERAGAEALLVRSSDGTQASGPILPSASGQNAQVTRIDLDELQRAGSLAAFGLRSNDTIFVPKADTIFVVGQVTRPGEYPIRSGTTLLQALSLAGGVTERGSTSRVKVVRMTDGRKTELSIHLDDIVQRGDTIVVKDRLF